MNLNTAALLCDRFLATVAEDGFLEKLTALIDTQNAVSSTRIDAAFKALKAYDGSIFADDAMRVFPEFEQLGLSKIMGADVRKALVLLGDESASESATRDALAKIAREGEGMGELTDQVLKLLSVADYFGVEKRNGFDADAIAVIQMPALDSKDHSPDTMNAFIDRMQSFQSLVTFCERKAGDEDETAEHLANIRMISGDDPLMIADMSVEGAANLQNLLSEVRRTQFAITEIEEIRERLSNIGVSDQVLDMLIDEKEIIERFEGSKVGAVLKKAIGGEGEAKEMASTVMSLMETGARIDSVIVKSVPGVGEEQDGSQINEPSQNDQEESFDVEPFKVVVASVVPGVPEETVSAANNNGIVEHKEDAVCDEKTLEETSADDNQEQSEVTASADTFRSTPVSEDKTQAITAKKSSEEGETNPSCEKEDTQQTTNASVDERQKDEHETSEEITHKVPEAQSDAGHLFADAADKANNAVETATSKVEEVTGDIQESVDETARKQPSTFRSIWDTLSKR